MASEVVDSEARKVVSAVMNAIEREECMYASPLDVAHALTFIICLYKYQFGWTTEQVLKLYEKYIVKMEEALDDPEPYGEA